MKSLVLIWILGVALLLSGDRPSEALGVIQKSPGVFAVDAETFTVTVDSSTYLFKVRKDRLVLQKGCDLYSAKIPGMITPFHVKGKARIGVFRRAELTAP